MSTPRPPDDHCRAVRRDGSPCQGRPLAEGLCFAHSSATQESRKRGGHNRSNAARSLKALPERLRPVADLLTSAMARTFRGDMDPRQATALAALASALVRVLTAGEQEQQLRDMEAAVRAMLDERPA